MHNKVLCLSNGEFFLCLNRKKVVFFKQRKSKILIKYREKKTQSNGFTWLVTTKVRFFLFFVFISILIFFCSISSNRRIKEMLLSQSEFETTAQWKIIMEHRKDNLFFHWYWFILILFFLCDFDALWRKKKCFMHTFIQVNIV